MYVIISDYNYITMILGASLCCKEGSAFLCVCYEEEF